MAEKRAQLVTLGILEQGMTRLKREYLAAIAGAGYASFHKAETVKRKWTCSIWCRIKRPAFTASGP